MLQYYFEINQTTGQKSEETSTQVSGNISNFCSSEVESAGVLISVCIFVIISGMVLLHCQLLVICKPTNKYEGKYPH